MQKLLFSIFVIVLLGTGCDGSAGSIEQTTDPDVAFETADKPNETKASSEPVKRQFSFSYAAEIVDVPADAEVKVWVPVAETSPQQTVNLANKSVPDNWQLNRDALYGNQIGFFTVKQPAAGDAIKFSLEYDAVRKQAGIDDAEKTLPSGKAEKFLNANRLVPKTGKPVELLAEKTIPKDAKAAGELLYEVVENHMKYDKTNPGYGNGDSVWACDSKTGNCTDFHSLFISLARSQNIPARFQIGFPLSPDKPQGKVGGYHCWAWFHVDGHGWLPVDISEADKHPELKSFYFGNLTQDRIAFSTGRDIKLVPASKTESLNYFVYPHVEVDGKVWPKDKINLKFSYQNKSLPADPKENR